MNIMKRAIFFMILLCVCVVANAKSLDKEFRELIEQYDVADRVKSLPKGGAPADFWKTMVLSNEQFIDYEFKFKRTMGVAKYALDQVAVSQKFHARFCPIISRNQAVRQYCDSLLVVMGLRDYTDCKFDLYIYDSNEINAFCALTEEGFAILLPMGLAFNEYFDDEMIAGVVAHEFVHGVLRHTARQFFREKKKERHVKAKAEIASALNEIGEAADAYNTHYNNDLARIIGEELQRNRIEQTTAQIYEEAAEEIDKYQFDFSKELEFEADLIAYRFMDYVFSGESYIDALRAVSAQNKGSNSEDGDHPSAQKRIEFLKYAKAHPEIGNTINKTLWGKNRLKEANENE